MVLGRSLGGNDHGSLHISLLHSCSSGGGGDGGNSAPYHAPSMALDRSLGSPEQWRQLA